MMHNNDDTSGTVNLARTFQSLCIISWNGQIAYTHQNVEICYGNRFTFFFKT